MNIPAISDLLSCSLESSESNHEVYSKAVLAQVFILVGFLIKLGAAPLHQ